MTALRYAAALLMYTQGCGLEEAANALVAAIEEAKREMVDPKTDSAVLLLGAQLHFLTHADSLTQGGVSQLLDNCALHQVPHSFSISEVH